MRNRPRVYRLVRVLPRNLLSRTTGWLARIRLPGFLGRSLVRWFVRRFDIDLSEARQSLSTFRTIEDVFTRELRPAARPVTWPMCSPADALLTNSSAVNNGTLLQVKGLDYSVAELVDAGNKDSGTDFAPAWGMTFYLSPKDYHRVHSPVAGQLLQVRYVPGDLWPVNNTFVNLVPALFTKNERLVFTIAIAGGGMVDVVMVGALNVGRMITPFVADLVTNAVVGRKPKTWKVDAQVALGQELGTFMLGSSVVLVFDGQAKERFQLIELGQAAETQPVVAPPEGVADSDGSVGRSGAGSPPGFGGAGGSPSARKLRMGESIAAARSEVQT